MHNVSELNHTIGKTIRQEVSPDPRNISIFIDTILYLIASQNVKLSAWIHLNSCFSLYAIALFVDPVN